MIENFNSLNSIDNPLAWIGLTILVIGAILRILPIKTLDKVQVERLLHKYLNILIVCGLIAAILGIILNNSQRLKPEKESEVNSPITPASTLAPSKPEFALDEEACQSLIGKYKLLHEYDYVLIDNNNDDGIAKIKTINSLKTKTIKGYWDAQKCIRDEKGDMTLRGIDESVHAVTVGVGNKTVLVTELVRKLDSIVSFDKKGKIYRRKLEINPEYRIKENKEKRISLTSDFSNTIQKDIIQAIDRYKVVINDRHAHGTQHSCYSAVGEKNRKDLVISFCPTDKQDKFPLYYRGMLECTGEQNCKSIFDDSVYE